MEEKINLWKHYCDETQKIAKVFRTKNIQGDFAEDLMADFYGGELANASNKGYDFLVGSTRYQVKARMETSKEIQGCLSDIHNWNFDYLIVVFFSEDGRIKLVKEITQDEAKQKAKEYTGKYRINISTVEKIGTDKTREVKEKYNL